MNKKLENEIIHINSEIGDIKRIGILGSSHIHGENTLEICTEIGRKLAEIGDIALLTGGMPGTAPAISRSFRYQKEKTGDTAKIYHILPHGFNHKDYGKTLNAGQDMLERREVLANLSDVYIVVEGGPGTQNEAEIAMKRQANLIPLAITGGYAKNLYEKLIKEKQISELNDSTKTPFDYSNFVIELVLKYL